MPKTIKKLILDYRQEIEKTEPNDSNKIFIGLSKVDYFTGGLQKGTLHIIAGRNGNAPTAFRNNLLEKNSLKTLVFCNKKEEDFLYSYLSHVSGLTVKKLSRKNLESHEKTHLFQFVDNLSTTELFIKAKRKLTIKYIENYLMKNGSIEFILIENLDKFIEKKFFLLQSLEKISKKFNVLIVVFYKLREVKSHFPYKKLQPTVEEIYDEFQLENSTTDKYTSTKFESKTSYVLKLLDCIFLIFRPEYYNIEKFHQINVSTKNKAIISIYSKKFTLKNNIVGFNGHKPKFFDLDDDWIKSNWLEKLKIYASK